MAIYSLNVGSVGRTTHQAGTAGAHLRYISRPSAASAVIAHAMPDDGNKARAWMDHAEAGDRKNARVIDRIRLAIPRELTREQRLELVRAFCADVTGNRVPWFAALHQDGEDEHNPHAHIVVRDRDKETGKRVLRWSDSARDRKAAGLPENAVEMIRTRWEVLANQALERAGHEARIDRRSLEAQGIDRDPTIHIGPNALHVDEFVHRPESKVRTEQRGGRERVIDYPMIDAGRTRKERHAEIIDLNLERDARSPDLATRARAQLRREQIALDRNLERQLIVETRRFTIEERRIRARFAESEAGVRAEIEEKDRAQTGALAEELRAARPALKLKQLAERAQVTMKHAQEREALAKEQRHWVAWLKRIVDFTGNARREAAQARSALVAAHRDERARLVRQQKFERTDLLADFRTRRDRIAKGLASLEEARLSGLDKSRQAVLNALEERRGDAMAKADVLRQQRAAEREAAEAKLEAQLQNFARMRAQADTRAQAVGEPQRPPAPAPDTARPGFTEAADGRRPPAPERERGKGFEAWPGRDRPRKPGLDI